MTKETTMTPFMKQFNELKSKHPEAILLFRIGDFYETLDEDATKIGEILGITVTRKFNSKDKGSDGHALKLAGFPHHALDTYLPKLIRAGVRVAICDQLDMQIASTTHSASWRLSRLSTALTTGLQRMKSPTS